MASVVTKSWACDVDHEGRHEAIAFTFTFRVTPNVELASWSVTVAPERPRSPPYEIRDLAPDQPAHLAAAFPSGLAVSGSLSCVNVRGARWIVGAEPADPLSYGYGDKKAYFQGGMVELLAGEVPPPDPGPPKPPCPPDPPSPPRAAPLDTPLDAPVPSLRVEPAGAHGDLFPYVYMRAWPEPSPEALAQDFVFWSYPASAGAFAQQLVLLRAAGAPDAREQMERLAIDYIDGRSGAEAPFVGDVRALAAPVSAYREVDHLVKKHPGLAPEELVAEVFARLALSPDDARARLASAAYAATLVRVWQSYFALVVTLGFDARLRDALGRVLVVDHLLRRLVEPGPPPSLEELSTLARATVVLPCTLFPLPPAGASSSPCLPCLASPPPASPPLASPPLGCPPAARDAWIVPYAIGDLQVVRKRLVGYRLGDLAHVESVMAGERRRRVSRKASRVIQTSSRLHASDDARERAGSSRAGSLSSQVKRTLADTLSTTTFSNFSTAYGPPTTATLSGGWSVETKPGAGPPPEVDTTRFAKKVVDRALERVAHHVLEARSTTASRESEEETVSVIDNTEGAAGRRGVYRWLNEVYRAYVVNYGNRLVLEMILPDPARRYLADDTRVPSAAVPPVPPSALGIESFEDISRHAFALLAARYPSESLSPPPPARRAVSGVVRSGEPLALTLPEGYAAVCARVGYVLPEGLSALPIQGIVGRTPVDHQAAATGVSALEMGGEEGTVQVILQTSAPLASPPIELAPAQLTVDVEAALTEGAMNAWRLSTYQAILRAYAAELRAYQGIGAADEPTEEAPRHRYGYRAVERRELKRGAFDLLFQELRTRTGSATGLTSGGPSELTLSRPRDLQFFERAFEWSEISYSFMADTATTPGRRPATSDDRFAEFLEAAYAQVLVPVSPGEAFAVLYFLASGVLWDARGDAIPVHEADVALALEIKKLPCGPCEIRIAGDAWEIVVPTTLSVLADGDGALGELLPASTLDAERAADLDAERAAERAAEEDSA